MPDQPLRTGSPAPMILLANLSGLSPEPQEFSQVETMMLDILAKVNAFVMPRMTAEQSASALWAEAMTHVPLMGAGEVQSQTIERATLIPNTVGKALQWNTSRLRNPSELDAFVQQFLPDPNRPLPTLWDLTVIQAVLGVVMVGTQPHPLPIFQCSALQWQQSTETSRGWNRKSTRILQIQTNQFTFNYQALNNSRVQAQWEQFLQGTNVRALRQMSNFHVLTYASPPSLPTSQ